MKKKKKYKQLPLFPEIKPEEPKKRTGSKSLSYNTLSKIAESGGYSMILSLQDANAILWYSSSVDITQQVISELGLN